METNDLNSQLNLEKIINNCKTELYFSKNKEHEGVPMPQQFWKWYESKGYDKVLSIEEVFVFKAFMIGCCIEYLVENGQKITKLDQYTSSTTDILNYLKAGVLWT